MLQRPSRTGELVVRRMVDEFIESFHGKSIAQQTQAVGEKALKDIKERGAPKFTNIALRA